MRKENEDRKAREAEEGIECAEDGEPGPAAPNGGREEFVVRFWSKRRGFAAPAICRLRKLLKHALRQCGFHAQVEEISASGTQPKKAG